MTDLNHHFILLPLPQEEDLIEADQGQGQGQEGADRGLESASDGPALRARLAATERHNYPDSSSMQQLAETDLEYRKGTATSSSALKGDTRALHSMVGKWTKKILRIVSSLQFMLGI